MPYSAPSRCTEPQCHAFATHQGRCEDHRRRAWANRSRRNQVLDPTTWARTSRNHLAAEPACRGCGADTDLQTDHITEIADGGAPYDESNLQTLCQTCHIRKTREAKKLRALRRQTEADE